MNPNFFLLKQKFFPVHMHIYSLIKKKQNPQIRLMIYSREAVTTTSTKSEQILRAHHLADNISNKSNQNSKTHYPNFKKFKYEPKELKI